MCMSWLLLTLVHQIGKQDYTVLRGTVNNILKSEFRWFILYDFYIVSYKLCNSYGILHNDHNLHCTVPYFRVSVMKA